MSGPAVTWLRRAVDLLVEPPAPAPAASSAGTAPAEVRVVGLSRGCGASTVARAIALVLAERARVCDDEDAAAHAVVAVADGRAEPALAALVAATLAARHDRLLLVANRARDPDDWARKGAVCVPASRLGVALIARGRPPFGAMHAAVCDVARWVLSY